MPDITKPLRLATGNHTEGSGKGCAMNVVSWENGDIEITDLPACADPFLAYVVQRTNDTICNQICRVIEDGQSLLCPEHSAKVLDLAHRTVGTDLDWSDEKRLSLYLSMTLDRIRKIALFPSANQRLVLYLTERWLLGVDIDSEEVQLLNHEVKGTVFRMLCRALYYAIIGRVEQAASYAASCFDDHGEQMLETAHWVITDFEKRTKVKARSVDPEITQRAIAKMLAK